MNTATLSRLLTPREVADLLGIPEGRLAIWRCTKAQNLKWVRCGKTIRYEAAEVERFIRQNTEKNPGGAISGNARV